MRIRIALAVLLLAAAPAAAHVTLAEPSAKAGSHSVLTFRIGHGCESAATTALRVEIPENVLDAHPQPKAGWKLIIEHAPLAKPQTGDMGEHATQRVSAIVWFGGTLPSDDFDEFSVLVKLPADSGALAFPATQTCGKSVEHWSEAKGTSHPAPTLIVAPGDAQDTMPGMDVSKP